MFSQMEELDEENSWEPEDHFVERKCIVDFWADHSTHPAHPRLHSCPEFHDDLPQLNTDEQPSATKQTRTRTRKNKSKRPPSKRNTHVPATRANHGRKTRSHSNKA
jgi:hypothetical protein